MSYVNAGPLITEGLRLDFSDNYLKIRNRQRSSRLGQIMDLNIPADNRYHTFGRAESPPHFQRWDRGSSIPTKGFDATQWTNYVYNYGIRVPWHKNDRTDERTQSIVRIAREGGGNAAYNAELFADEAVQGSASLLPAIPTAPDGGALFSATDGNSGDRFGISGGNIVTGDTLGTTENVLTNYYEVITRFLGFKDTEGYPLLSPDRIDAGVIIMHSYVDLEIMTRSFEQYRQGRVMGSDAGVTPSNVVIDSSRNVELWSSSLLPTGDWYVFLKEPPVKPLYLLELGPLEVYEALAANNNSDSVRDTGYEYIQFEKREGLGVNDPFGAIKVNN